MKLAGTLIGMVHLPPLPGSPRWEGSMHRVAAAALDDARALVEGGLEALLVENYGDAPFTPGRVAPATVAAMGVIAAELRHAFPKTPLGVNVLKNDARAALAIACAVGGRFIRVNVHAGAVVADQGIVQTTAYRTLRDRRLLGADVKIFADVGGKHAQPLVPVELEQTARDLVHRGLADALVVSGPGTGRATPVADVKRVRLAVPDVPLLVGSGVTPETVAELLSLADAVIVGTYVKAGGDVRRPVDPARVERLVAAARRR
ncbi:MAG: phosphorybosylanthranilate isomerase [Candidatus Rokuibacteriota bacterium]|nr:MAG: phosphorybosylanthranilate isomerase [Candidatus Rokubacteria bacterium]